MKKSDSPLEWNRYEESQKVLKNQLRTTDENLCERTREHQRIIFDFLILAFIGTLLLKLLREIELVTSAICSPCEVQDKTAFRSPQIPDEITSIRFPSTKHLCFLYLLKFIKVPERCRFEAIKYAILGGQYNRPHQRPDCLEHLTLSKQFLKIFLSISSTQLDEYQVSIALFIYGYH